MNLRTIYIALLTAFAVVWGAVPASATVLTTDGGAVYTSTIKAPSEGSVTLKGPAEITCGKSTIEGTVESHGEAVTTEGKLSSLSFSECGSSDVTTEAGGTVTVHATEGGNGTLTSTGTKVKVQFTSLGLTCEYTTSSTHIGTFTGSLTTIPNPPTMDISATLPRTGGSAFCGSTGTWTGSYGVTTPALLIAIQKDLGIRLDVNPNFVKWTKDPEPLKLENKGKGTIEALDMDAVVGFQPQNVCWTKNVAENKYCSEEAGNEEKVGCETKGIEGAYWAFVLLGPEHAGADL